MLKFWLKNLIILCAILSSCSKDSDSRYSYESSDESIDRSSDIAVTNQKGDSTSTGLITAGEWHDLSNWNFWKSVLTKNDFSSYPDYWSVYTNNRVSVLVVNANSVPVQNVGVELKRNGAAVFKAKTNNLGQAELWVNPFKKSGDLNLSNYTLEIQNSVIQIQNVLRHEDGINTFVIAALPQESLIEIAFVVDATGSMGDELEFLKTDLKDVIARVKNENPSATIQTASIFYRDQGDDYVTKRSDFTSNSNATIDFIQKQTADGGGDFPEAVHTALHEAVTKLKWTTQSKTKLLFLVLDAPPHHGQNEIQSLQSSMQLAAEKGIRIIPITASGIDKETEFLMRFLSITTNGTYVFITNHSGIGEAHLEATVGEYEVEFLNDLMVRLITTYSK